MLDLRPRTMRSCPPWDEWGWGQRTAQIPPDSESAAGGTMVVALLGLMGEFRGVNLGLEKNCSLIIPITGVSAF